MRDIYSQPLADTIREAWALRHELDLRNVGYGKIHWGNLMDAIKTPYSYYYFLAGLTRLTGARRILEVGTHQGGSTRSFVKGLVDTPASKIVTFDITPFGSEVFAGDPVVRAFTMNANSEAATQTCIAEFGGNEIDLAYIDSNHEFWATFQSFGLCTSILKCPIVVLDDITLNDSMNRLWRTIQDRYGPENAVNAAEIDRAIRDAKRNPGFGVVRLPI